MGRHDIMYVDPVQGEVITRIEEHRKILTIIEVTRLDPKKCLACTKPADVYMGLRVEEYESVIWEMPFCESCKDVLEGTVGGQDPMRFYDPVDVTEFPDGSTGPPPPEFITEAQAAACLEEYFKKRENAMLGLENPPDDGRIKHLEEKVAAIMLEYPQGNWAPSDEKCPRCDTRMDYKSGHMPRYHCPQCDHELEV